MRQRNSFGTVSYKVIYLTVKNYKHPYFLTSISIIIKSDKNFSRNHKVFFEGRYFLFEEAVTIINIKLNEILKK